ncbi:TPA: hypothetical protein SHD19_001647 [Campylobacter coli]|uniref:hypothetical protein n=1 Tax=Campylobacter coli TaxID=195 RepID=UPI00092EB7D4|nr:hypothetical protein [Campylobacter coli]EAH7655305.1 hypothetical protein [Campylobacter coli]EAI7225186.1 hypothetical protein [Campylobacter coli]EHD2720716.1 hypothetical protein [Campylobacter coli]EIN8284432.1 hypothetical protein [Campylobacter coli]EKJ5774966.1 hypothetical protein [Campylobacter coli]
MFNYAKYENATQKELIYALSLVEKKAKKLALETKENKEALKFLQKKIRESLSTQKTKQKKQSIPELDEAIEDYKNGNVETYANFEEYKKAMSAL